MNLRQIDYVLAVAEEQNFTRAAARCHTVQSALSHQIARLEQEFGTRLFERSSRQVALSPAGRTFVSHARLVQEAAQRLRDEMMAASGEIRGSLTIGTISTLTVASLPQLLASYHQQHPQVDIRLHVGMSDKMLQELREQTTDVAFLGLWPGEPVEGVEAQLLSQEPLVALLHPQHPLASQSQLSLQQLAQQTLVDYQAGTGPRQQTDAAFLAAGIERRVAFEVNHAELLESIIGQGLAIGMIPLHSSAASPKLITIPVEDAPERRVYFAWGRNPTPAAAAFQALVTQQLQGNRCLDASRILSDDRPAPFAAR